MAQILNLLKIRAMISNPTAISPSGTVSPTLMTYFVTTLWIEKLHIKKGRIIIILFHILISKLNLLSCPWNMCVSRLAPDTVQYTGVPVWVLPSGVH